MKYFKASITIENNKKKYGNLPMDFVLGYENSDLNEVYFCLLEDVNVHQEADITEIEKVEYDSAIEVISRLDNTKRQEELEETIKIVKEKQNETKNLIDNVLSLEEGSLFTMDAIAEVYEKNILLALENAQLKQESIGAMEAIAQLYEMTLGGM